MSPLVTTDVALDRTELAAAMGRWPLALRHDLGDHPLLSRAALARVASQHPAHLVEHHRGDLPLVLPTGEASSLALTPQEVVEGIETNGCWMVLWGMDAIDPYGILASEWMAPVRDACPARERAPSVIEALALLASPGAVVPAHVDHIHNVLFQLEGTKQVFTGAFRDASEAQRQVERRYGPARLNLDRLPERVAEHRLGPGDALYIPPFTPHWVVGGPDVSVALSCSFTTAASRRFQDVHACNARLRRIGVDPYPPGASRVRDLAKVQVSRTWWRSRRAAASTYRHLSSQAPSRGPRNPRR